MRYSKQRIINKPIPDYDINGLVDRINVNKNLKVTGVGVHVNIMHTYTGDLSIELSAPDGTKKTLLSPSRMDGKNMNKHFNGDIMSKFIGLQSQGEWSLRIIDAGADDSGDLIDWTLSLTLSEADSTETEIFIEEQRELDSVHTCQHSGKVADVSATINLEHSQIEDLVCTLKSPSGKTIILHDHTDGLVSNSPKYYDAEFLKKFRGEETRGDWTLSITNNLKGDLGQLKSWKLNIETKTT